ncbi:hypothetical protein PTKIN_Ptkin16aG0018900 [Pterospermum kingtungense]
MHDLVNDLAQHIAGELYFNFEDGRPVQNPARVRHMSCILEPSDRPDTNKLMAFSGKNKVLRTFLPLTLQGHRRTPLNSRVLKHIFPAPSCLRVLSLSSYHITEFPDSVYNLKQLRYLDLSGAEIHCLPDRVSRLSNLETLKLSDCFRLARLPEKIKNLTKLEHLDRKMTSISNLPDSIGNLEQLAYLDLSGTEIRSLPQGVCSLHNLQTLKLSNCLRLTSLPTDMNNLTSLKHLDMEGTPAIQHMPPRYRGTLNISQLNADVKDKKHLRKLVFEWDADLCNGSARNAADDHHHCNGQSGAEDDFQNHKAKHAANILDQLKPGENLERLEVKNFFGQTQSVGGEFYGCNV